MSLLIKSQCSDFTPVHREVMYAFQLSGECRNFAELGTHQIPYQESMSPPEASDIMHGPLHRHFDAAISAAFDVNKPKGASMYVDADEEIFPQLGCILQEL
jgi:hypothetical protein